MVAGMTFAYVRCSYSGTRSLSGSRPFALFLTIHPRSTIRRFHEPAYLLCSLLNPLLTAGTRCLVSRWAPAATRPRVVRPGGPGLWVRLAGGGVRAVHFAQPLAAHSDGDDLGAPPREETAPSGR